MRARLLVAALAAAAVAGCGGSAPAEVPDPAEVVVGERLFREGRFSRFFADASGGDVNAKLRGGDPVLEETATLAAALPGPYAGGGMNCAACHLVDEQLEASGGGMRTYADFARRSPVPDLGDGRTTAPRNSPALVGASLDRSVAVFFHFDGEFATLEDLVRGTITGRNFGWRADQAAEAVAHVARVVRGDDGSDANAEDHGGRSYRDVLAARGNLVPREIILPPGLRIDVDAATDDEVVDAVAKVIAAYVRNLAFATDETGAFVGSPFDAFLRKNGLPALPDPGEDALAYARRLRGLLDALPAVEWVGLQEGRFAHHVQAFEFGPLELRGLRTFLREASDPPTPGELAAGGAGSCVRCHAPPAFTDFRFHNVGVAQAEYDGLHGAGAFAALPVPDLATRDATPAAFLPPAASRPDAPGPFLAVPDVAHPERTDLGLWNVLANDALPAVQPTVFGAVCDQLGLPPTAVGPGDLLPRTIAWFKTPGLRDLGHSAPYFHTGAATTLEDVVRHYLAFSELARAAGVRNEDPVLPRIAIVEADVAALVAFLRSLNEDYE